MTTDCSASEAACEMPWNMADYVHLKERVLACISAMSTLGETLDCAELREKIETNTFNLVVVGQFKRGKTCLINALLGTDVLPMSVVPLTSIVTILTHGDTQTTQVFFNDGKVEAINPNELSDYVTEIGNPRNTKNVREVLITYPSSYLKDGARLIDTPGVGSVYLHNTDVAYRYLPKSDAALFLLSVEQPVSKAELDFLKDVHEYSGRIFFLLNKIDFFSEEEVRQTIEFSKQVIKEAVGFDVNIFPISAKLALDGKLKDSQELIQKSNLPSFSEVLNRFLMHEKGKVLLLSVTNGLLRILSQARLTVDLQMKSLSTPLEEIKEKVRLFQEKKNEIIFDKRKFDLLLEGELERIRAGLDADLAASKGNFILEMQEEFDGFYEEQKSLPLKELDTTLENYAIQKVELAFNAWRQQEDEKLSKEFAALCNWFTREMNGFVDALMQFSSELFAVPFEPVEADALWTTESGFYYKFKEEQVGLSMLESSITHVLPGLVSNRFQKIRAYFFAVARRRIYKKRRQQMLESIEMQAGRVRFDFLERLNKSKAGFRDEIMQKIEMTIQGIVSAIEKGMDLRSKGEEEAQREETRLRAKSKKLEEMKDELRDIRVCADSMTS